MTNTEARKNRERIYLSGNEHALKAWDLRTDQNILSKAII